MNVIIPVAGIGKRLRPHTYSTPKALLMVGGKPLLGHILDKLKEVGAYHDTPLQIIFVVGHMGDKIKEYVSENYNFNAIYIEQKEHLGLGHAIWLTREIAESEPCIIVYGDTVFKGDIPVDMDVDGLIGVKPVADPRRFGVVEVDGNSINRFVEKPEHPTSNLAIVGVNFIKNSHLLFEALELIINRGKRTSGEFQLTDAFESMLNNGARFKWFPIEEWYDCGKPETLLSTNRAILSSDKSQVTSHKYKNSVIISPIFIHNSAKIEHSIIGPNVSIDRDSCIKDSIIFDSIINQSARIENSRIEYSIIGANTVIKGVSGHLNIGEFSELILNKEEERCVDL